VALPVLWNTPLRENMKNWNSIWMLELFIAVCFIAAGAGAIFTGRPDCISVTGYSTPKLHG
jgi:hypothetical protein